MIWVNQPEEMTSGASYSLEQNGSWTKPDPLNPSGSTATYVAAAGLASGGLAFAGSDGADLEVARLDASGAAEFDRMRISDRANNALALASSPRAIALLREEETGTESNPVTRLKVWVFRP